MKTYRLVDGERLLKTTGEWEVFDWDLLSLDGVLEKVRTERDALLKASDKIALTFLIRDYPQKYEQGVVEYYRKTLRDFPSTIKTKPKSWEAIVFPKL